MDVPIFLSISKCCGDLNGVIVQSRFTFLTEEFDMSSNCSGNIRISFEFLLPKWEEAAHQLWNTVQIV